ncbi:MAG: hypothetical protein KDJ17_08175 [Hyphomicrobiaceae bacterium]|nr:hypothetical protein [Hyphomicrobiaceae bacterium]
MANYLLALASEKKSTMVRAWAGQDARSIPIAGGHLFVIANGSTIRPDGSFFKGYVIDHERRTIGLSGGAYAPDARSHMEGCYVCAQPEGKRYTIGADAFAQFPMLFFAEHGIVAVSDSMFALTKLRKYLGLPCKIDEDTALARSWLNAMAAQQLSDRTLIAGIHFCPPGTTLSATAEGDMTVERTPARHLFQNDIRNYSDEIRQGAERSVALISTFLHIPDARVTLALSGGHDSRVCLAAALKTGGTIGIRSNVNRPEDLAVALALGEKFGFDVNKKMAGKAIIADRAIPQHQLERWFFSNAGLYDPLYAPVSGRDLSLFNISGTGAEMFKGNYGWRKISAVARIVPEVGKAFRRDAEHGLEILGIDRADPHGSEWHYLGYRNAIHAGRSTMLSLLTVRPFLQKRLVGLSRSTLNAFPAPKKAAPSIVTDLMIVLNPQLAAEPFDTEAKNLSREFIEERTRVLGSVGQIEPYTVCGNPLDDMLGFPHGFVDRLGHGTKSRLSSESIAKFASEGWQKLPQELQEGFAGLLSMVEQDLAEPIYAASRPSMAAGKLMAFCLAD